MTIREERVSHTLFLCMMHGISIPYTVISSVARNLFRPLFPSSFAKSFTGSTAPTFSRYGVSRFSLSNTRPLTANEKDPSASLGMTIREERVSQRTLYTIQRISIPPHCHFERSEKSFSSPFSTTPSLSLLGEAPSPPFLRYSVSHFSLSGTLPLTANEKDPSTSLGMTLRKWRFPNISFIRDVGYPSPIPYP